MRIRPPWPSVELLMGPRSAVMGWGNPARMQTPPPRPSMELPVGQRNAVPGGGDAYEHRN
eukprot:2359302-Pyramimonas_sp.AAC.1